MTDAHLGRCRQFGVEFWRFADVSRASVWRVWRGRNFMDQELNPSERKLNLFNSRHVRPEESAAVTHLRTRASGPTFHIQMQLRSDPSHCHG